MWTVIGLGNPGSAYEGTRHNIGFQFIDRLAQHMAALPFKKKGSDLHVTQASLGDLRSSIEEVLLVKPQKFMNLSGQALHKLLPLKSESVVVVHDDLDLPLGSVRLKQGGSAGGHKGVLDIARVLGPSFWRLRLGIGRPAFKDDVTAYVLQRFKPQETISLTSTVEAVVKNFGVIFEDPAKILPLLASLSKNNLDA